MEQALRSAGYRDTIYLQEADLGTWSRDEQ